MWMFSFAHENEELRSYGGSSTNEDALREVSQLFSLATVTFSSV